MVTRTMLQELVKVIQDKIWTLAAKTYGFELKAVVIRYRLKGGGESTLSFNRDRSHTARASKAMEKANSKFNDSLRGGQKLFEEGSILYNDDFNAFLSCGSSERAGTGICIPIVSFERIDWCSRKPITLAAALEIGIVGGTQDQNIHVLSDVLPTILRKIEKSNTMLGLPKALYETAMATNK